jgi:hypothetical protein
MALSVWLSFAHNHPLKHIVEFSQTFIQYSIKVSNNLGNIVIFPVSFIFSNMLIMIAMQI